MLEELKTLLGDANTYTDEQIGICLKMASAEVEAYCNRTLDYELENCVIRIAIIKLGRIGADAVSTESYSGVSQTYLDGYPADVLAILNRKRKVKLI